MPRNVEIKAKVPNMEKLKDKVKNLANDQGITLVQEDVFFNVPKGRLKLRSTLGKKSQLISYERPDQEGPKLSDFHVVEVDDSEGMKTVLTNSLGVYGVIRKKRGLIMYGQTRIHLDEVEGLGDFMELEVVLNDDQTTADGEKIAEEIMLALNIERCNLIDCAYMDLIFQNTI